MAEKIPGAETSEATVGSGGASVPASRVPKGGRPQRPSREDARPTSRLKASSLLDTRVVYCGDNLEQSKQLQKKEGSMMKMAPFPILHSAFHLNNPPANDTFFHHCDWHTSF